MSAARFTAVCFDFDGTLADSYAAIAASVNHVRASHGLAPLSLEEVTRHVGRGPEHLLQHTVPRGDLHDNIAEYRRHHPSVMFEKTELLPGARETLESLHARGKRLALCSNKPRLFSEQLLRHVGVAQVFTAVLGPEDVPRLKPAPDMLLAAMERLRARPEETLYVGDMVVDIQTARGAGVTVWVVPTGSEQPAALQAAGPDRILPSLHELADPSVLA